MINSKMFMVNKIHKCNKYIISFQALNIEIRKEEYGEIFKKN